MITVRILAASLVIVACAFAGPLHEPSDSTPSARQPQLWGYDDVDSWSEVFPSCGGKAQSPIDFRRADLKLKRKQTPITFERYDVTPAVMVVQNNGHSAVTKWTTKDIAALPSISGGGLKGDYVFSNFHFHWGSDNTKGSEHTFDGKSFPGEVHLVHFKKSYGTLANALKHEDGLAVLGVMVEVSPSENPLLEPIIDVLEDIEQPNYNVYPESTLPLDALLPEVGERGLFYRYRGSLTTPTCNEVVMWTVFDKPIKMSSLQLGKFRSLKSEDGEHNLENNYRPVQPLNDRKVLVIETEEVDETSGL